MPIKLIVTHKTPDLDAIASIWLLKRFDEQHFETAAVEFVNPGDQISLHELSQLGYYSYDVVHVDTGGGEFDHHKDELAQQRTCAADLVLQHINQIHPETTQDQALNQLVNHVIDVDLFEDVYWPERNEPRTSFRVGEIIAYLKNIGLSDHEIVEYGLVSLDSVYVRLKILVASAEEMPDATQFKTQWGPGIGLETANTGFVGYAQRQHYAVVVRKDKEYGHIQIKALPRKNIDLSDIYEKIISVDKNATWYLHPSKTMLLNGSDKRRNQVASSLSLSEVIDLIRTID